MAFNITVTGMVLSAVPIGEYDKRITILTRERGKITAFARGARRSGNQMMAAANPFVFGEFEIYPGKSSYKALRAEITNYFRELAADYDMVCYGSYFLEVADYYGQENADETKRLQLLYQTLRALESKRFSYSLIRGIYDLKTLAINGEYPNVYECLACGAKEDLDFFSMRLRGCVCKNCQSKVGGNPIDASTLYAMQYVISTPIEKLFTFRLSESVEREFLSLLRSYRKNYENHRFKAEDFLE